MNKNKRLDAGLEEKNSFASLMARSQKGDKAAYNKLLSQLVPVIHGFVSYKLDDRSADDVTQEVLISIHKSMHTYDPRQPFKPWFYAICRFRINDYLRTCYKNNELEQKFAEFIKNEQQDVTVLDESNENVNEVLSFLNEKQRKILTLMKVEGYSAREVGLKENMSTSAVKVAAHRAYKKLRQHVKLTLFALCGFALNYAEKLLSI